MKKLFVRELAHACEHWFYTNGLNIFVRSGSEVCLMYVILKRRVKAFGKHLMIKIWGIEEHVGV